MDAAGKLGPATPPRVWAALYAPFGMSNGYVTVTLAWLLAHAGASVAAVAGLAAWGLLPNTWKVLWSPLVDTTLTARIWFLAGLSATAVTLCSPSPSCRCRCASCRCSRAWWRSTPSPPPCAPSPPTG